MNTLLEERISRVLLRYDLVNVEALHDVVVEELVDLFQEELTRESRSA